MASSINYARQHTEIGITALLIRVATIASRRTMPTVVDIDKFGHLASRVFEHYSAVVVYWRPSVQGS